MGVDSSQANPTMHLPESEMSQSLLGQTTTRGDECIAPLRHDSGPIRKFSSCPCVIGKCLFLYLITNAHSHLSGIYYLPEEVIQKEMGITKKIFDTLFDTLSKLELAFEHPETNTVFIRNMFRYQGRGEKNERAAAKHLTSLHHTHSSDCQVS